MFGILRLWVWTSDGEVVAGPSNSPHNDYQVRVIDNMPSMILPNG